MNDDLTLLKVSLSSFDDEDSTNNEFLLNEVISDLLDVIEELSERVSSLEMKIAMGRNLGGE